MSYRSFGVGSGERKSAISREVLLAALVFGGCFLGAAFDTWLRFPGVGAAQLFPQYAIVTFALWRSPPRRWWLFLLLASVGDFVPHRLDGASVPFFVMTELVNHGRAVLAAVGLRRFAGAVKTLRELVAYLVVAVFVAPSVAGFLGAAVVTSLGTASSFAVAWQTWTVSNAMTGLTLLSVIAFDTRVRPRFVELAMFVLAFFAVSYGMFATSLDQSYVHLYWASPFLLWAAVRFGRRGTAATLLAITIVSLWAKTAGGRVADHDVLELQVFLIAVAVPALFIAVLLDQLARSQQQFKSVVEDQLEMIGRFRPDGTCTFANRAYGEAFGVRDPIGRNVQRLVPAGVYPSAAELAALVPASPIASHELELPSSRWQQWQVRGLFDDRGTVVEYQAVGRDITDRKRAEVERNELEARRSMEAVLRDEARRKDEFLAMLSHELRNPLAPIGVALEVMVVAPPQSSEATSARESIGRQLRQLTRLVDDLLDMSRVRFGKIQLELEPVNLARVITDAIEATRPYVDSFGHAIAIELPTEVVWVRGDDVRLVQVISNLVHNAAKYTKRGGRITITATLADGGVRIVVGDSGIGLDPNALEMIFELFTQTPAGREHEQSGLGIGLTLVKHLVELHGGTVAARSDGRDRGTEIILWLPVTDAPPATVEPARPARIASTPLRILAVDDNIDLANGLQTVLGLWGHTVRIAHDGSSALAVAAEFAPDIVILDHGLPLMSGTEVARRLREMNVPALLISISGFGQEVTDAADSAFHHHLAKPIDLDSLHVLLEQTRGRPT